MKTLSRNQTLAAALMAAVTFALPAAAQAQSYNSAGYDYVQCKKSDKDNQLIGGILGAVAGGVFGSQVAGNGARTEGSVLGAVVGAAAGAGIADDNRNCTKEAQYVSGNSYNSGRTYGSTYTQPTQTYGSTTYGTTYGSTPTRTYGSTHGTTYGTTPTRTYGTTYGSTPTRTYGSTTYGTTTTHRPVTQTYGGTGYTTTSYGHSQPVNRVENIKYRIETLRAERQRLEAAQRRHYSHHRAQQIAGIGSQIEQLKNRKRRVKSRH